MTRKTYVKRGVDDGQVQRQEKDDRLEEEQLPWSSQSRLVELLDDDRLILLVLGPVGLARRLAETGRSLAQEHWRIRLGDHDSPEDRENTSEDRDQGGDPSPSAGLAEESTDLQSALALIDPARSTHDRADRGPKERSGSEHRHAQTPLSGIEDVGHRSASVGQG